MCHRRLSTRQDRQGAISGKGIGGDRRGERRDARALRLRAVPVGFEVVLRLVLGLLEVFDDLDRHEILLQLYFVIVISAFQQRLS